MLTTKNRQPTTKINEVSQLSWLERYTDNVEVGSSSLPETTNYKTADKKIRDMRQFMSFESQI